MKSNIKFPHPIKVMDQAEPQFENQSSGSYIYKLDIPDAVLLDPIFDKRFRSLVLVAEVNCSATMYRECFKSDHYESIQIEIDKNNISDKFEIDYMFLAKETTVIDSFRLDKGMPLIHLGSFAYRLDRSNRSLILFAASENKDRLEFDLNGDEIKVLLPQKEYDALMRMQGLPVVSKLLENFGQLALLEACRFLHEESSREYTLWFRELYHRWEQYYEEGSYPTPDQYFEFIDDILKNSSIELARIIIQNEEVNRVENE